VDDWGKLLGDSAAVTAMLDRLLHHRHVVTFPEESSVRLADAGPEAPNESDQVPDHCELAGTLTVVGTGGGSGLVSGAQNVTGTQTGLAVDLTTIETGSLQLTIGGLVDASGKQITIRNPCGTVIHNGNYTITLTRPQ
jgi:hypothetical protein